MWLKLDLRPLDLEKFHSEVNLVVSQETRLMNCEGDREKSLVDDVPPAGKFITGYCTPSDVFKFSGAFKLFT